MEPKKDFSKYDLDSLDMEIFSTASPQVSTKVKKHSPWQELLNKTYIRTGLTLTLLLFLFGSTFFIASKIAKPSFTISSANIGYIPKAQIDIPQPLQPVNYKSCSEINYENKTTFLFSFCQGDICANQTDKETCEDIDVVVLEDDILSEVSGQDGIPDCVWEEESSVCKPKY